MKTQNIRSLLRRRLNQWIDTIDNKAVQDAVNADCIVTGGAIASMLLGEKLNDVDVYFKTPETVKLVAEYYVDRFKKNPPPRFSSGTGIDISVQDWEGRIKVVVKSAGVASESGDEGYQYFEGVTNDQDAAHDYSQQVIDAAKETQDEDENKGKPRYRPIFVTTNAISLSQGIQVVIRFHGQPDQIHENYDFVHCTCSYDYATRSLVLPPKALESLLGKYLIYKGGSKYPLCSFIRTRKFIARGWTIDAGQYVKMAWDLNQLDLSNAEVLEDQMVGVDAAYFQEVISILKEKNPKEIDGAYLIEVIDKVFGD